MLGTLYVRVLLCAAAAARECWVCLSFVAVDSGEKKWQRRQESLRSFWSF